jgi:hypothetical protein
MGGVAVGQHKQNRMRNLVACGRDALASKVAALEAAIATLAVTDPSKQKKTKRKRRGKMVRLIENLVVTKRALSMLPRVGVMPRRAQEPAAVAPGNGNDEWREQL